MAHIGIEAMSGGSLGIAGGMDVHLRELVQALARYGGRNSYSVLVTDEHAWTEEATKDHMSFVPVSGRMSSLRYLLARSIWRLRRLPGDEFWPVWDSARFSLAARRCGVRLVHFPRNCLPFPKPQVPYLLTFFDMQHEFYPEFQTARELARREAVFRPSVAGATHIIASSEFTAQNLRDVYGVPDDKITVLPCGIDADYGRVSESEVARVRERYQLPARFLFYPANPWPHKNHPHLFSVLRDVRSRHPDVQLVTTGRLKNERWHVGYLAEAAGITEAVHDLGFVETSDLPALYHAAEAMVFPSLFEGFGIPVLEAMACGCPVVASSATCLPEVVGDAGLLVEPRDGQGWSEAIERVWQDPELRLGMAERGRKRSRNYLWENLVADIEAIYAKVHASLD